MRIYQHLYECAKETQRNLWEMGHVVNLQSMQNLKGEFETREILGETYRILDPIDGLYKAYELIYGLGNVETQIDWVHEEFKERIDRMFKNPGTAWKLREKLWTKFMRNGEFEYTYNERLNIKDQFDAVVNHLRSDPNSRRVVFTIYDSAKDIPKLKTVERVPCSVSYSFIIRDGRLNMFYHMRSSDLYNHWLNDIVLARMFQKYLASYLIGVKLGWLQMSVNSLHAYSDELKKRNIF